MASSESIFRTLGSSNHTLNIREENDFYATDPIAMELLLNEETFSNDIWECACGEGHLSEVLKERGYNVYSTDIIDRGYGDGVLDFLNYNGNFCGDIITNPPYKFAEEFVRKAIDVVEDGNKVAMFLRVLFLEGKSRKKLFEELPPKYVYISSGRICCCKNGDFSKENKKYAGALAYAWFIWEKGYTGNTIIKWFN